MRPAIATVAGLGWEQELVRHARATGRARLLGRCTDPVSLREIAPRVDVLFLGSEVPWLDEVDVTAMRLVTHVVGVAGDRPGARLLAELGVDDIVAGTTPPAGLLAMATLHAPPPTRHVIEVTGPRGAPGRSEVAFALVHAAARRGPSVLVELDTDAPSLGIRAGLPPGTRRMHPTDGPSLLPIPIGRGRSPLAGALVESVAGAHRVTVLDGGPASEWHLRTDVDRVVVVGEATPCGLVRLAALFAEWTGPVPDLVVNRHVPGQDLDRVRAATGLEPAAVIPVLDDMRGTCPHPRMERLLEPLAVGQWAAR